MKILIIRTFPDVINPNSYNVQEIGLAKALIRKGHQCGIVLFHGKVGDKEEAISVATDHGQQQLNIYWLQGYGILKNGFMPSVYRIAEDYDVLQLHEYDQLLNYRIFKKCQKPIILYHGPYADAYTKGYHIKCLITDVLHGRNKAYKKLPVLTKSELATDFLRQKGFVDVTTVGVGLDVESLNANRQVRNQASVHLCDKTSIHGENSFRLLYIGKLEERRNIFFLLNVFRKLRQKFPQTEFLVIGDGNQDYKQRFLAETEKEREQGCVQYRERIGQKELANVYQNADVFLLASHYEIFGMVLLEAMYFGLPVISTRNGGSVTLIEQEENGYIMDDVDENTWTQTIEWLILHPKKRMQMGVRGQQLVKSRYLWDSLADRFVDAYWKVLEI